MTDLLLPDPLPEVDSWEELIALCTEVSDA